MHPEKQLSIARNSEGATSMAVFSPVGAALEKLSLNGVAIIDSDKVTNPAAMFFGSVLAPWPNRLADHTYFFAGQHFTTPNVDHDGNSNHGLIFNRNLEIKNHTNDSLTFGYQFGSDESYPFEIDLSVSYQLIDSGLKVSTTAVNQGRSAPFGIGFHPYFSVGRHFKARASFTKQILVNEKMIPTSDRPIKGLIYEGGEIDDCFTGAQELVLNTESYSLTIALETDLPYLMLYRPNIDCGDSLLAIEPMSCQTNAFNSDAEAIVIESGETKKYEFTIRMN